MKKTFFVIIAATAAIVICNYSFVFCDSSMIVDEILKMHESGLSEATILTYLQSRSAEIELTSEDLIKLRKAGFSEEFIQALFEFRMIRDYDSAPQPYDYGGSYFSLGFNYSCFPFYVNQFACNSSPCRVWGRFDAAPVSNAFDQKRYFYSGGHAYIRHNGHFHIDDEHRFQSAANLNQLPENVFISSRPVKINVSHGSFNRSFVSNRRSGKSATDAGRSRWGTVTTSSSKAGRSAGSFHGVRSGRSVGKIGFGQSKAVGGFSNRK